MKLFFCFALTTSALLDSKLDSFWECLNILLDMKLSSGELNKKDNEDTMKDPIDKSMESKPPTSPKKSRMLYTERTCCCAFRDIYILSPPKLEGM